MQLLDIALVKSRSFLSKHIRRKCVSPSIYYSCGRDNLGDSMVPWLIREVSGCHLPYSNPLSAFGPHLLSIGSILRYATSDCYVWGTGFMQTKDRVKSSPQEVSAVRGPLSANKLHSLGIPSPQVYGDPALLTSRLINIKPNPVPNRVGLIPHYADWDLLSGKDLALEKHYTLIDIRTSDIYRFVREILRCELIVSTSLHGLIIADSYRIPTVWCKVSNNVAGDGFKFHDYYMATRSSAHLDCVNLSDLTSCSILPHRTNAMQGLSMLQDDLLGSFPGLFISQ